MDPLPSALFRREMGWLGHSRPFDYSRVYRNLHAKPEDHILTSLSTRDDIFLYDENGEEVNPVYNMDFCSGNKTNLVAVGYESGFVTLIDTQEEVKEKLISVKGCHSSAVFSLKWSSLREQYLATGSGDQIVKIWDCSRDFRLVREFRGHTRTVKKVIFHPSQQDIVVSASRDGAIRIWDLRSHNELSENYITCAHSQPPNKRLKITIDTEVPVTDLLFQDENILISCGSHDGFIKFWDLRKTYKMLRKKEPVRKISYPLKDTTCVGFSSMCLDETNNLYAASASREIFKFSLSSESEIPDFTFENNEKMLFDIKMSLSPCGRYLGSGSRSSFAHIWDTWNTSSPYPLTYLETEANCVLFSPNDPLKLVTGGDDGRVLIWRADDDKFRQRKNTLSQKDLPPRSLISKSKYLEQCDKYALHPKYQKVKSNPKYVPKPSSTFDLSSLLNDLPNAVIDGNFSNTRTSAASKRWVVKRPSIIKLLIRPSSITTPTNKRPAPSTKISTPKIKRRKSIASNSPNSAQHQPKILSFLQPLSQSVL